EQQQSQVYGTAQAAVKDVSGFCERNPSVCATGKDAFAVFMHKARFGAEMLMSFVKGKTGFAAGDGGTSAGAADMVSVQSASAEAPSHRTHLPPHRRRGRQAVESRPARRGRGSRRVMGPGSGDRGARRQLAKHAQPGRSSAGLERATPGRDLGYFVRLHSRTGARERWF